MSKRKIRIDLGTSDFRQHRESGAYYVDKSLFLEALWESGARVLMLPRPRRFGKTLNLSMIRYFFEKRDPSCASLFHGLLIEQKPEIMAHQDQYPVIYLSFKDVKVSNFDAAFEKISSGKITGYLE